MRQDTDFSGQEGEEGISPSMADSVYWGAEGVVSDRHWLWISSAGTEGAWGASKTVLYLVLTVVSLD